MVRIEVGASLDKDESKVFAVPSGLLTQRSISSKDRPRLVPSRLRPKVSSRSSTMALLLALKLASCCSMFSVTMSMALALWTICPSPQLSFSGILVLFVSRGLYLEVGGWDRIRRGCLVRCRI